MVCVFTPHGTSGIFSFLHFLVARTQPKIYARENFSGILNSDRYASYNWVGLEQRQLCWAHLKREFIKISERTGVSQEIGNALVKQQEKLFELWHRVRDGTLKRSEFQLLVQEIRTDLTSSLQEAANYEIGSTRIDTTCQNCPHLSPFGFTSRLRRETLLQRWFTNF